MPSETIIDCLRHGECEGGEIYRGSTNVALSERGWQQMQQSVDKVSGQWQVVVSSPMLRCVSFAEHISAAKQLDTTAYSGFRETHFGDWEGQKITDVWANDTERVSAWSQNPVQHSPPNGELTKDFMSRVNEAFDALVANQKEQHVGLIIHGGVMRVLLSRVLQTPFNGFRTLDVPYACLSRIRIFHTDEGDFSQLVFHNVALP